MFLSLDLLAKKSAIICLFSDAVTTDSQIDSEPTFISVSSTTYSLISSSYDITTFMASTFGSSFIFLANKIWFRLIKKASLSEVYTKDKPEKYKHRP